MNLGGWDGAEMKFLHDYVDAEIFGALGDPTRLALVSRLADGEPRSIGELGRHSAISRQALTKHCASSNAPAPSLRPASVVKCAFKSSSISWPRHEAFLATVSRPVGERAATPQGRHVADAPIRS